MENYKYGTVEHRNGLFILTVSNTPIDFLMRVHSNCLFDVSFKINENNLLSITGLQREFGVTFETIFSKEYLNLIHQKCIKNIPLTKIKYVPKGWYYYIEKIPYKTKVSNYQIIYK